MKALRTKYEGRADRRFRAALVVFAAGGLSGTLRARFRYADYVVIASVFDTSKATEKGSVLDTDELDRRYRAAGQTRLQSDGADAIVRISRRK